MTFEMRFGATSLTIKPASPNTDCPCRLATAKSPRDTGGRRSATKKVEFSEWLARSKAADRAPRFNPARRRREQTLKQIHSTTSAFRRRNCARSIVDEVIGISGRLFPKRRKFAARASWPSQYDQCRNEEREEQPPRSEAIQEHGEPDRKREQAHEPGL